MKKSLIYILLLLLITVGQVFAEPTNIVKIHTASSNNSVQIYVTFQDVPRYRSTQKGKRIDIILDTTLSNTEPIPFVTDDRVVKFLTQQKQEETILTFFLRYEPQRYALSNQHGTTIVLDILLGNQFTKAYPELSSKLDGLTMVTQESADYANPYISSPYAGNWNTFFSRYTPEFTTTAPVFFTSPPFPVIDLIPDISSSEILNENIFQLAAEKRWDEIIQPLLESISLTSDEEEKKLLALTFGEVLFLSGDFENSYKQLYLLERQYSDEYLGIVSSFLIARLRAGNGDVHAAEHGYDTLAKKIDKDMPLFPYVYIAQIETALATSQFEKAGELLQKDDLGLSPKLSLTKELRQSDYWYGTGDKVKAYVGYTLFEDKTVLETHPYSLNGFCNTLYIQKKFKESAACFQKLSSNIIKKDELSLISLKKALAELTYKTAREMYVIFSSIEDTYPGTKAGYRAALKKADLRYLSQPSWRKTSAKYYKAFAEKATDRGVAEEAAFKEAIVHNELGNVDLSITKLLEFLRNFRAGELTRPAKALLIEVLPQHLQRLLDEDRYVDALVLAKKNRELFQNNWIDIQLLSLLAKAYHELSIFEESKKLYLYLLSTADMDEKQNFYLPLISILYEQENYDLVEDYSAQYNYNYPKGADSDEIYLVRLKSLVQKGNDQVALKLLSQDKPHLLEVDEIAAQLYFGMDKFTQTVEALEPYYIQQSLEASPTLFMLAESYFQIGDTGNAEPLFHQLIEGSKYADHARYRLATIERDRGRQTDALKLLNDIVEKGKDPLWQKLAQKELKFHEIARKY